MEDKEGGGMGVTNGLPFFVLFFSLPAIRHDTVDLSVVGTDTGATSSGTAPTASANQTFPAFTITSLHCISPLPAKLFQVQTVYKPLLPRRFVAREQGFFKGKVCLSFAIGFHHSHFLDL